jgi:hypothetical protein
MPSPKIKHLKLLLFILVFCSLACTEIYNPNITSSAGTLVVDGKISNKNGPYKVSLFRTTAINSSDTIIPEVGAAVIIHCDDGNSTHLTEFTRGIYLSTDPEFKGEINKSYWVEIVTQNGNSFESIPEKIQNPLNISDIYAEVKDKVIDIDNTINTIQFFYDAKDDQNEANYVFWKYQESWEWRTIDNIPKSDDPAFVCYPYSNSNDILIYNSSILDVKDIKHLPLSTITENDIKFLYKYYLRVNASVISKRCYDFWKSVQSISQSNGSLFDVNPSKVNGKIICCDHDPEVLGYFQASAETTFGKEFSPEGYDFKSSQIADECEEYTTLMYDPQKHHFIEVRIIDDVPFTIVVNSFCYDCSLKYSPTKPSFWL